MVSITVRDVSAEARDRLAAKAAQRGQSLQEFMRLGLEDWARRPDPAALMSSIRARVEQTDSVLSSEVILAAKDEDRR